MLPLMLMLATVAGDPQPAGVADAVEIQQFRITSDEAWRRYRACIDTRRWIESHRYEFRDEVADEMLLVMQHQLSIYDALTDAISSYAGVEFRAKRACDLRQLIGDEAFYSGTLHPLPLDMSGAYK